MLVGGMVNVKKIQSDPTRFFRFSDDLTYNAAPNRMDRKKT